MCALFGTKNEIPRIGIKCNKLIGLFFYSLLFPFWSLFSTSLSLIPKCLNDYKIIRIAEMIYKKKHIDLFLIDLRQLIVK